MPYIATGEVSLRDQRRGQNRKGSCSVFGLKASAEALLKNARLGEWNASITATSSSPAASLQSRPPEQTSQAPLTPKLPLAAQAVGGASSATTSGPEPISCFSRSDNKRGRRQKLRGRSSRVRFGRLRWSPWRSRAWSALGQPRPTVGLDRFFRER